ncbi:Hsp33 family molecular chaperone HslO [Paenalcaligenes niemegkensis]|uniref:Hsp33 family molecular chaperone HslO n=1 Tax=Paenalcaligenes niemegkensis TaxID=2895469 RepID=UPI001EE915FA|nr:Hsp33 family molecular chaperone HslO [Paenalcaligenes niemegkensis]MCQ9616856.1 Hsp33 family molecular chaperone HslO [Paenalcaligenes niemegkensis]
MTDHLKKYLFADRSTRAQTVSLENAWRTGLSHQQYPENVQNLLGELTAAAVLLAGNLKFEGSLVLQIQGDGPIALLVVECSSELNIRATVSLRENQSIDADASFQQLLNANGNGRFIVVLDPDSANSDMQPYQGVVPLEGDTVADVLEDYMRSSEQLDTKIWLQARNDKAVGLLLQKLPGSGGDQPEVDTEETWQRAKQLAATIQPEELLAVSPDTLIHRLFWEEDLIALDGAPVQWHCPCSRERVAKMLNMLGRDEIESILSERDIIEISCNFCGKPYEFDAVDCAGLFIDNPDSLQDGGNTVH